MDASRPLQSKEPRPDRFGRLFPDLPALQVSPEALKALAEVMVVPEGEDLMNREIPAGYTYLGQFIDHDITLDATPSSRTPQDPTRLQNFRTPAFDLDNVYGGGPVTHPHFYQRKDPRLLTLGMCKESRDAPGRPDLPAMPKDLPRNSEHYAVIGDPRDDENVVVGQVHVALAEFHNKVVTALDVPFDEARRITTWHYQWIALHDFATRICGKDVIADVLAHGRKHFTFERAPFMPVEFSVAAFRFGHSMVRQTYDYNRLFGPKTDERLPRLSPASLPILFAFTGASGNGKGVPLASHWAIDWRRWFDVGEAVPNGGEFNVSHKLDPYLVPALHKLPGGMNLAMLNLARGVRMQLPSGQGVARAMGIAPLTPEEVAEGPAGAVAMSQGLASETPLWFYILQEARVRYGGHKLGPVGARIVAEVFVGLLQGDPDSFLAKDPNWQPTLGATPGQFTMADMLKYVGNLNPIGD